MAVPNAPTSLISGYTEPKLIDLSWTAPVGGDVATGYVLYSGSEEGVYTGTLLISGVDTLSYQFTGTENVNIGALGDGETVYFKIHSVNGDGESVGFDDNTGTTMDVPYACTDIEVVIGSTALIFSWTDPVFDGGSEILLYNIYTGPTEGTVVLTGTVSNIANDYSITGLSGGVTRFFQVSAVNALGEGPLSTVLSGRTSIVPGAPTTLATTDGDATVRLAWVVPVELGNPALTQYNVYRGVESGILVLIGTTVATIYNDTGLTNNTTYYYKVSAESTFGEGLLSSEVDAKPEATVSVLNALSNKNLRACGAVSAQVYNLTGGHSWTFDIPANKKVVGIFGEFSSIDNMAGTLSIITSVVNKTIKVYDGTSESTNLFDVTAVVYYI